MSKLNYYLTDFLVAIKVRMRGRKKEAFG